MRFRRSITSSIEAEGPGPVCTQPECVLRKIDFNRTHLAELLVEAVSRDGETKSVPEQVRIVPGKACSECALRVVRGQRPFPLADAKNRIIEEIFVVHGLARLDRG